MTGPALAQSASGFSSITLDPTTTDNLLLLGVWYFADNPPIPAIDGWTFLAEIDDGGDQGMALEVWYRVSDGSEGGSYTPDVDWTDVDRIGGYRITIDEWSDWNTDLMLDGLLKTGLQSYNGPLTLSSITTTADDGVLLFYGFSQSDSLEDISAPSGMTELYNDGSGRYLGYQVIGTAGPTGSKSFDADPSSGQVNLGIMFALAAEGATPPSGGPDVEISGETALVNVTAGTATAMTYTPARIGGVMRTVSTAVPFAVSRVTSAPALALSRVRPPEPIVLDRDGPGAPIVLTRTKGEL